MTSRHYRRAWSDQEIARLRELDAVSTTIKDMAITLDRHVETITSKLIELGLHPGHGIGEETQMAIAAKAGCEALLEALKKHHGVQEGVT